LPQIYEKKKYQQAKKKTNFEGLLKVRKDVSIKDEISKYLLHYHTEKINKRDDFKRLGLKETWGEGNNFKDYINGEAQKYLQGNKDYDPFAVCCAVRVKIEENIYNKLKEEDKEQFLKTHETRKKIDFAVSKGAEVPFLEIYYLLAIIYNKGMHWDDSCDNITPIVTTLTNLTIKQMINEVFK